MVITNTTGLPEAIVRAVTNDPYPSLSERTWDISVTELISPPQQAALKRRHADDLTEDASDRIWALFGQSIHTILERAEPTAMVESRLQAEIGGWKVSGQVDHLSLMKSGGWCITDYKTTSSWSVLNGAKVEWETQLNVLRVLAEANGYLVSRLRIVALLRDWSKGQAKQGGNYPQSPVVTLEIPIREGAVEWIETRVKEHQAARLAVKNGNDLAPCTPEERWERPTVYAVKKPVRKSAVRLYAALEDAQAHADREKGHFVETRPGEAVRCAGYCPVAHLCAQRQAELVLTEDEILEAA